MGRGTEVARRGGPRRLAVAAGLLLALGAWSGGTLAALAAALPRAGRVPIPFGESGFGDGLACLQCVEEGRRWQRAIAGGEVIVLFDSDCEREDATSPAGVPMYGRIGARAAGRPEAFLELYAVLQNVEREDDPPRVLQRWDATRTNGLVHLETRLAAAGDAAIVWEFRHPTAWEQSLADRLERAGGIRRALDLPDIPPYPRMRPAGDGAPPFQIVTPLHERGAALAALRAWLEPPIAWASCATAAKRSVRTIDNHALTVIGPTSAADADDADTWTIGSYAFAWLGQTRASVAEPVAVRLADDDVRVLDRHAHEVTLKHGAETGRRALAGLPPVGRHCAAAAAGRWFAVDGLSGALHSDPPAPFTLPPGRWTGLAGVDDTLVLAGDGELVLLDAGSGAVRRRFPARITPPMPHRRGDCPPIALGDDFVVALDAFRGRLAFYGLDGRPLGDVPLSPITPLDPFGVAALGARGRTVAIAQLNRIELLDVALPCRPEIEPATWRPDDRTPSPRVAR
ncbi:MAG: hypothetical protein KIT14_00925 [bacterium]|nr:hypothetical protein [bacterium]